MTRKRILLTGATGYVGGRLLSALEARGDLVRCMSRRPENLAPGPHTEAVQGDALKPETLGPAMDGVHTAYYMVHSMAAHGGFAERDTAAARNFAAAAADSGVQRIVYLGGLSSDDDDLSDHLRSRQETGAALRSGPVPVIELRASIIIGSGSLSFDIVRALVERLPVMTTPSWVRTPAQPIAIEDVIAYLLEAGDLEVSSSRIYEIGGADQVSYGELMREYGRQRGLKRIIIPVSVLSPRVSSLWLALVTPAHAKVGRLLVEGLRNPSIVRDPAALRDFQVRPMGIAQAIKRALRNEDQEFAATRWSDALSAGAGVRSWGGVRFGSRIVDSRNTEVNAPPGAAFAPIRRIGGDSGWYCANLLWRIRGLIDSLIGGVGLRRGRKNPEHVRVGETLDFWRVEAYEPDSRLRLFAEMKVPGRAWLEFEVTPRGDGSLIRQTALFDPNGLLGLAYWYALYPVHALIFAGMLRGIARRATVS